MAEMARAVEAVDAPLRVVPVEKIPARPISVPVAKAVPLPTVREPLLTALPALTMRGRIAELSGSLALTALFGGLATALWAALGSLRDATEIGPLFFLTLAVSWSILLPAKIWTEKKGDSWARRLLMMVLGVGVGICALWLEGWSPHLPLQTASAEPGSSSLFGDVLPAGSGQLSYFALAFFGLRWWKMTDRRRCQRFSLGPLLAAGLVGGILLLVWPQPWRGLVVLVTSAAIVQLVSPWDPPARQAARRLRLKYA
jgi:hypothetical protein